MGVATCYYDNDGRDVVKLPMSFPSNHGLSVFTNACRSSPCNREAKRRPKTAPLHKTEQKGLPRSSVVETKGPSPAKATKKPSSEGTGQFQQSQGTQPVSLTNGALNVTSSVRPPSKYSTLFQTLIETNSLLQEEVRKLKREHKIAMSKLTHLESSRKLHDPEAAGSENDLLSQSLPPTLFPSHNSNETVSEADSEHQKPQRPNAVEIHVPSGRFSRMAVSDKEDSEEEASAPEVDYQTPEEFHSDNSECGSDDYVDRQSLSDKSIESYQITYISSSSSEEESSRQYASPGMLAVGKMWDNFAVDDYPAAVPEKTSSRSAKGRGKGSNDWVPRKVTVPKPFNMTVREANTIKKKSKSMIVVERESAEKLASEVAETTKKFRANPIPVHTYLPLYELTNAKNEQRRELVKKMTRATLTSKQKPFNFTKRDELRQKQKAEMLKEAEKQQRKATEFKAKPLPSQMFSPTIEEEAMEKEAYRKIRMQMRAAKLLAESKPPYSMRMTSQSSLGSKSSSSSIKPKGNSRSHASYTRDCSFHPKITHKVPNYNRAYCKFQEELMKKKQSKLTTVSEPFLLHTEKRAKVKQNQFASSQPARSTSMPQNLRKCHSTAAPAPPYPPHMTETARRRQSLTQERLAEAGQKEATLEDEDKARKLRSKAMQKLVAEKSSMLDMGGILEEKKKIKIHQFK